MPLIQSSQDYLPCIQPKSPRKETCTNHPNRHRHRTISIRHLLSQGINSRFPTLRLHLHPSRATTPAAKTQILGPHRSGTRALSHGRTERRRHRPHALRSRRRPQHNRSGRLARDPPKSLHQLRVPTIAPDQSLAS